MCAISEVGSKGRLQKVEVRTEKLAWSLKNQKPPDRRERDHHKAGTAYEI
jgi:hypothetical protein